MLRVLGRQVLALCLVGASLVGAHTISFNELNGARLCVEPRSLQVAISSKDGLPDTERSAFIAQRLHKSLVATLKQFAIPFTEKTSCDTDDGFVYVLFFSTWGRDTNDLPYLIYAASVQAGAMPRELVPSFELLLPKLKFENYYSVLLFEDELPSPVEEGLAETNEEMIIELATSWWESYELLLENRRVREQLYIRWGLAASVLLTSLILALGVGLQARKQKKQEPLSYHQSSKSTV